MNKFPGWIFIISAIAIIIGTILLLKRGTYNQPKLPTAKQTIENIKVLPTISSAQTPAAQPYLH